MTTATLLPVPKARFFDANGDPLAGGKVYTYVAGTVNTPKTSYTTAAANVSNANPVVLNSTGEANIWLVGSYKIVLTDANDAQQWSVDNITDVETLITLANTAIYADFANTSNTALGDALVGVKQPVTGAVARTQHTKNLDVISVKDFGATGDGSTDDTAAFNAAISYANSKATHDATNVIGTTITIPDGRYKLSPTNAITVSGAHFVGSSRDGAVILCQTGGTIFSWVNTSSAIVGGGAENLKFEYTSNPAITDCLFQFSNVSRMRFQDFMMVNVSIIATMGSSNGTYTAADIWFSNLNGYVYNGGAPAFSFNSGAGFYLANSSLFVGGVTNPTINRTSTMITVSGTNVFNFGAYSWDAFILSDCIFERFYHGIQAIAGANTIVNDFLISNCFFDYISDTALYFYASSGASGGILGIHVTNTWLASWSGLGISLVGPGTLQNHTYSNIEMPFSGNTGIQISAGCKDIIVNGCDVIGSNRLDVNASAIAILGGDRITVTNCRGGYNTVLLGFNWQAFLGISNSSGATNVLIANNHFEGSSIAYDCTTTGSGYATSLCKNNLNANYSGNQTSGIYVIALTTVAWVNNAQTAVEVYIYGGTMTVVAKNAVQVGTAGPASLILAPGESFTLTYSGAPTVKFFVQP